MTPIRQLSVEVMLILNTQRVTFLDQCAWERLLILLFLAKRAVLRFQDDLTLSKLTVLDQALG